jgi:hypothetical protein
MDKLDFIGFSSMRDSRVVVVEEISSHFTCRLDTCVQPHADGRKESLKVKRLAFCSSWCPRSMKSLACPYSRYGGQELVTTVLSTLISAGEIAKSLAIIGGLARCTFRKRRFWL